MLTLPSVALPAPTVTPPAPWMGALQPALELLNSSVPLSVTCEGDAIDPAPDITRVAPESMVVAPW